MKFAARAAAVCALALALVACSTGKAPAENAAAPPPPPQKTVFDTQFKALQKAKDVQKTVDQQKADMDQKLKDEGG
jgi:Spy/CpxP family protein refolding chaperone